MKLADLPTPSLVLDRVRLARNAARMRARAADLKVSLRPHLKTAKSAEVARVAHGGETGPITVSTLAEAEYFAARGFTDILYAVGIVPGKLDRAAGLMARGVDLKIVTDEPGTARAIIDRGRALGAKFRAIIEIDTGGERAGVAPDSPELLELGAVLGPAGMLAGVMAHAGHSYHCESISEIEEIAEAERAGVARAAERLRQAGYLVNIVSVGSTPTALHAKHLAGVTEMRPGVYVFFDLFQVGLGMCSPEDVAVGVLASVTGHRVARKQLLLDAGGLALSKDIGANEHVEGAGYGFLRKPGAALPARPLAVLDVHQEHGIAGAPKGLDAIEPFPYAEYPIGAKVMVMPNHVCMTSAMYDRYHVIDGSDEIVAVWDRVNGW
ncbi:MAG: alanine racemase [Tagaea sp.]|nr:alanine racemase [Tagaea sp.]